MIGIVFGFDEEAQLFLKTYKRGRFEGITEGETSHDDDVLLTVTGRGKIKATLRIERLLGRYDISHLVHAGVCLSLRDDLAPGTLVGVNQVFEGDKIELAAPTYPRMPLETTFNGLKKATLVTQDHDLSHESEISYWKRIADVVDGTGYAVAYVAATHGIPCHIVKVVTGPVSVDGKGLLVDDDALSKLGDYLTDNVETLPVG